MRRGDGRNYMTIQELRENIDRIDQQIVQLYCERMETARQIGAYKQISR